MFLYHKYTTGLRRLNEENHPVASAGGFVRRLIRPFGELKSPCGCSNIRPPSIFILGTGGEAISDGRVSGFIVQTVAKN